MIKSVGTYSRLHIDLKFRHFKHSGLQTNNEIIVI